MAKAKNSNGAQQDAVVNGDAEVASAAAAPISAADLDPEIAARIASLRSHVRESFGKVVMAMMMLPRYRQQTLADLQHLVLEPLIRDRIAIAQRAGENAAAEDIAGVAIWASVSDEAEARIVDQIKGNMWPLRLRSEDWASGSNNWLIDVIAPDQRATASVIANFRQVVKDGSLKLHPLITKLLDEETLKKMGAQKLGGPAADAPVPAATASVSETVN